jgi:hypothetical protein
MLTSLRQKGNLVSSFYGNLRPYKELLMILKNWDD